MNKHVPEDGGTVRSSGYGLMVVKTTDSTAEAEQIALSGASRGSTSDPEVPNDHCPPRRSSRPPRRATEHAGGRSGDPARSAGGHPVDSWRPVIRLPVSIHLV